MNTTVLHFADLAARSHPRVGGKAGVLARLFCAGYPVPEGFVVLPQAFEGNRLTDLGWAQVQSQLQRLYVRHGPLALAVRSSALVEDGSEVSFAGAFTTMLDVMGGDALRQAITTVYRSKDHAAARIYAAPGGVEAGWHMAVVVQELVHADYSGVLFTVDPASGDWSQMVGHVVAGMGAELMAGEVTADSFTLGRKDGSYTGPPALRAVARRLFQLARRLEQELGAPQDIEWAVHNGQVALLQARPITTLRSYDPLSGLWNDSLRGDYLWTSTNVGEALPDIVTPLTWSVLQIDLAELFPIALPDGHPVAGNIGGRFYLNLSAIAALADALGVDGARLIDQRAEVFGRIPPGVDIPRPPLARWPLLRRALPVAWRVWRQARADLRDLPVFVAQVPARSDQLRAAVGQAADPVELRRIWHTQIEPLFRRCCHMLRASAGRVGVRVGGLRPALARILGQAEADALLASPAGAAGGLASLGPLLGLAQLARGDITHAWYTQQYGHRGPHEIELSAPRPAEHPDWPIQLAQLAERASAAEALLAARQARHTAAVAALQARHQLLAGLVLRRIAAAAEALEQREAVRSAFVRMLWVIRAFALRAGQLTGLKDDIFFLSIPEVLALLGGQQPDTRVLVARRTAHQRTSALPVYPALIRGRFDPLRWAADPRRRSDLFDPHAPAPGEGQISGLPAVGGVAEGRARVLATPEQGSSFQAGEVLVAGSTNIGWAPIFPVAAAIVTDVGAPLSHAAILARELGIPAVVGCGDATQRIQSGDYLRVDGDRGIVEIIQLQRAC